MRIIKKISIKTVCGDPFEIMGTLKSILLMSVIGEVTDTKLFKSDKYKDANTGLPTESYRLLGQFRAQNINTRENFQAAECFLPEVAANLIQHAFESGKRNGFNYLQFALNIGCRYNAHVACRYEYFAESLVPMDEATSPFAAIEQKIKQHQNSLPAPQPQAEVSQTSNKSFQSTNPGGITDPSDIPWEN